MLPEEKTQTTVTDARQIPLNVLSEINTVT